MERIELADPDRMDAIVALVNASTLTLAQTVAALRALDVDDDELAELGVLERLDEQDAETTA